MLHERQQVFRESVEMDFRRVADRAGFAVGPGIEGDEAKPWRGFEQVKGLGHIAPQAMLEKEGNPRPFVAVMKFYAVVLEKRHLLKEPL